MVSDLRADADIRGERVNVGWLWRGLGERPPLRLVRRRGDYPAHAQDGLTVLDLADLFRTEIDAWPVITRVRYSSRNSPAEGGLLHLEARLYYTTPAATQPEHARISYFDDAVDALEEVELADISRIETSTSAAVPWATIETVAFFTAPGGGAETLAGTIEVRRGHDDDAASDEVEWRPAGAPIVVSAFDSLDVQRLSSETEAISPQQLRTDSTLELHADATDFVAALASESGARQPLQLVHLDEVHDADSDEWLRRVRVADIGLSADTTYYYAIYLADPTALDGYYTERRWRAQAAPTGRYGLEQRTYDLIPALHRRDDEPDPARRGQGQLRRFSGVFGSALDQLRGFTEGLRQRHDVREASDDLLPRLSRLIGWEPDLTAKLLRQRSDILFAPEIYETVGTLPNVRALVNRVIGWESRTKEFVHNVFLTNAPEGLHSWELWHALHDGAEWSAAEALVLSDGVDGHPVLALAAGTLWLFWHSDRSGRRELWLQRLDGVDALPRRVMLDAPDDAPGVAYADEDPTAVAEGARVWLFWSSNRSGSWEIWTRSLDGLPATAAEQLTDHAAEDRRPAAVFDSAGRLWLFWQSNRRGPTDIWARVRDGTEWGTATRITTADRRDEMPAAVVDAAGRIWLFWSAYQGDRRVLYHQILDGGSWSAAAPVIEDEPLVEGIRDESPAAVIRGGELWLFWHSNRGGHWNLWSRIHDGTDWGPAGQLIGPVEADVDATAAVVGADLRLVWRTQRRAARHRSRTIDVNDADMLAQLGRFEDRAHYTYDTAAQNTDWYARDTLGIYLAADTENVADVARVVERIRGFIAPFRPTSVRYVWLAESPTHHELIGIDELLNEDWSDTIS